MVEVLALRGAAFDLDGTLVDSAPGLSEAVDHALADFGLPAAGVERLSTWIGNGSQRAVSFASP